MDIVKLAETFEKAAQPMPPGYSAVTAEEFIPMVDQAITVVGRVSKPDVVEGNPLETALDTLRNGSNIDQNTRTKAMFQARSQLDVNNIQLVKQVLYSISRTVMPIGTSEREIKWLVPNL